MTSKTALTIIVSIIFTIIAVAVVNVGISLILEQPQYENYCSNDIVKPLPINASAEEQEAINRQYEECYENYEEVQKSYNQSRYYILAGVGFVLLLLGLFVKENMIQFSGLASGGILIIEGVVVNLQNKLIVFISLLLILVIFGFIAFKVINKKK